VSISIKPSVIQELNETRILGFLSCGWELQVQRANRLVDLIEDTNKHRCEAITKMDEAVANQYYLEQEILYACHRFLSMWIFAKKSDMDNAWEAMVDTQATVDGVCRIQASTEIIIFDDHLRVCEQVLFRPQTFISSSIRFSRCECSICKGEYGECDHVAGRLYMGEICIPLRRGDVSIEHFSIVKAPKDKCCRVLRFEQGTEFFDSLTMRSISEVDTPSEEGMKIQMMCLRVRRQPKIFRFQKSDQMGELLD
jgi:hypothetical protein